MLAKVKNFIKNILWFTKLSSWFTLGLGYNTVTKKRDITSGLVFKISLVFVLFTIVLILIVSNQFFLDYINSLKINTNDGFFAKIILLLSSNKIFNGLLTTLGIKLSPTVSQLLALLLVSYSWIISLIILSQFWNIFILPLICLVTLVMGTYFKIFGNIFLGNKYLFNFFGIKIFKDLSDSEKLIYLKEIYLTYCNNLENNKFIKTFCWDSATESFYIEKFKNIADPSIIETTFNKDLNLITETILTKPEIYDLIKKYIVTFPKDKYNLILNEISDKIDKANLKGNIEIEDFIKDFVEIKKNSTDWSAIWETTSHIVHHPLFIGALVLIGSIVFTIAMSSLLGHNTTNQAENLHGNTSKAAELSNDVHKLTTDAIKTASDASQQGQQAVIELTDQLRDHIAEEIKKSSIVDQTIFKSLNDTVKNLSSDLSEVKKILDEFFLKNSSLDKEIIDLKSKMPDNDLLLAMNNIVITLSKEVARILRFLNL